MQLNPLVDQIEESETIKINSLAQALRKQGKPVFNLAIGELDFETPKFLQQKLKSALKLNKYTPPVGLMELRHAIAVNMAKRYRFDITAGNVACSSGAKQAIFFALKAIVQTGEEVIVPTPAWVSYKQAIVLAGGKPVFVPLNAKMWDLDAAAVLRGVTRKTKAVILNSPHNPTGKVFSGRQLSILAKNLVKRNIFIISDDIYNGLIFNGPYHHVSEFLPQKDRLIMINGFSKSYALTGWRMGFAVAHERVIENMNKIQSHASGNPAVLSQHAALLCLKNKTQPRIFARELAKRRRVAQELLKDIPGLAFVPPEGAFYIFLDIRRFERDSKKFCERLLQRYGVLLASGEAFEAPGFVRLSFAASPKVLQQGIRRLKAFVIENYPQNT